MPGKAAGYQERAGRKGGGTKDRPDFPSWKERYNKSERRKERGSGWAQDGRVRRRRERGQKGGVKQSGLHGWRWGPERSEPREGTKSGKEGGTRGGEGGEGGRGGSVGRVRKHGKER